jgi:hypothetical protein
MINIATLFNRDSGWTLSWVQYPVINKITNQEGGPSRVSIWLHPPALTSSWPTMSQQSGQVHVWCRLMCKVLGILDDENKRWLSKRWFTWNKRWLSKRWFTWEWETALKMLVCMRTRDGSQNVGLHEKERRLSKCWFAWEQEMTLKTMVYKRTWGGSQNTDLHENMRWLSKHWFTQEQEMTPTTLVYSPFNHLAQLLTQDSFTELIVTLVYLRVHFPTDMYWIFSFAATLRIWRLGASQTRCQCVRSTV